MCYVVRSILAGRLCLSIILACATPASAQEPTVSGLPQEQAVQNKTASCLEPPPMVRWEDYQGPFQKAVGVLGRKLERKSARPPRYKPGAVLCSLEPKDKFDLFLMDTFEPVSFLAAGFDAGMDQASNRDPSFGQGAEGYGKRYAADFASQTSWRFFTDFAYPTIFSEDPRYYRLGMGSFGRRFLHAIDHAFVAHRDDGTHMFNISEWMGTASAVALSDAYHPGNQPGLAPAARRVGYVVLQEMGFDVLREFWPEIARKLHMPFRGAREPQTADPPR